MLQRRWSPWCVLSSSRDETASQALKYIQTHFVQISVADKRGNASVDDKAKVEELEARISALHEGLTLQRRDHEDKVRELRQQIQNEQLNTRVVEQKVKDMQEQVNLANERAFDAEARLGRMQKAHATLVAERNRSQFSTTAAATAKAAAADTELAKDLEEIDALGSLLDVEARLRSLPLSAEAFSPVPTLFRVILSLISILMQS